MILPREFRITVINYIATNSQRKQAEGNKRKQHTRKAGSRERKEQPTYPQQNGRKKGGRRNNRKRTTKKKKKKTQQ